MSRTKVLHVTECFAGGVSRAITARVNAMPNMDHYLLWAGDEPPQNNDMWADLKEMPAGFLRRIRDVQGTIATWKPDIVHAHSSWAGVYTRIYHEPTPILYEPHCFKFDDPALNPVFRFVFFLAEKMLARKTASFGVLSAHEERLVRKLQPQAKVTWLPNNPTVEDESKFIIQRRPRVVMIGRITEQKDPKFFVEVINKVRALLPEVECVWVGDGDVELKQHLLGAGVQVTGWLDKAEIPKILQDAVYFHSASYEGFPLSVLDAAASGAPIVARSIPALDEVEILTALSSDDLASLIFKVSHPTESQEKALAYNRTLLEAYNPVNLAKQLYKYYDQAVSSVEGNHEK